MQFIPTPDSGPQVYYVETERTEPNGDVIRETHQRYVLGWHADDLRQPLVIQPDGSVTTSADWLKTFNRREVVSHGIRPRYNTSANPWHYVVRETTPAPEPVPVPAAVVDDFYRD